MEPEGAVVRLAAKAVAASETKVKNFMVADQRIQGESDLGIG